MTRIDAHLHVYPPEYVEALTRLPGGLRPGQPVPALADAEEHMRRFAIDAAVVTTGPPGVFFGDQAQANELARMLNERAAELVSDRFAALATLPLPDVDAALAELEHALDVLKLDGVWLLTNVGGTYLGDPSLQPLFDELERRGTYVFVHPAFPPYAAPLDWPAWLVELPFETTRAVVQILYSGTLDRCPSVRFQLSHLGGTAPFLADRIASLVVREPRFRSAVGEEPLTYFKRFWYDTGLSNAMPGIAATLAVAAFEQIVFGTDWPYAALPEAGDDPAPLLDGLGARRAQIDSENVVALVPRFRREGQE